MYYQYFGLSGPPFGLSDSPAHLYLSAGHREGMAALQWGLREPSGFTMLVGDIGTGKTTLVHSMLANRSTEVHIALVTNSTLSFEDILRVIAGQIGFVPRGIGKLELIEALDAYAAALQPDESVVLIFDEAQNLSDVTLEELRLLSNSPWPVRKRIQIVLVGQLELAHRLERPELRQLNQRIGARALLPILRPEEIAEYVEYRLRAYDGDLNRLFTRGALRELARHSDGIPRRINMLCHNALLLAYAQQAGQVSAIHMEEAARDFDHLLADTAPVAALEQRQLRGPLLGAGAAVSLGLAALALCYFMSRGTINPKPEGKVLIASPARMAIKPVSTTPLKLDRHPEVAAATAQHSTVGDHAGTDARTATPVAMTAAPIQPMLGAKATDQSAAVIAPASIAPTANAVIPAPDTVVVKDGDTLGKIALRHFADVPPDEVRHMIALLVKANPQIEDANRIFPGQIIHLQEASKASIGSVSR